MPILPNPFDPDETTSEETNRFALDEAAFVRAIEPPLRADDLIPVLQVLAGHGPTFEAGRVYSLSEYAEVLESQGFMAEILADIEPIRAAIARH